MKRQLLVIGVVTVLIGTALLSTRGRTRGTSRQSKSPTARSARIVAAHSRIVEARTLRETVAAEVSRLEGWIESRSSAPRTGPEETPDVRRANLKAENARRIDAREKMKDLRLYLSRADKKERPGRVSMTVEQEEAVLEAIFKVLPVRDRLRKADRREEAAMDRAIEEAVSSILTPAQWTLYQEHRKDEEQWIPQRDASNFVRRWERELSLSSEQSSAMDAVFENDPELCKRVSAYLYGLPKDEELPDLDRTLVVLKSSLEPYLTAEQQVLLQGLLEQHAKCLREKAELRQKFRQP